MPGTAFACEEWFQSLKITDAKKCESKCRTSETDMATYMCPQQCDILCKKIGKPVGKDPNLYGLTDDEVKFCASHKVVCIQAYKLTWTAESLCKEIYETSELSDESDACRHYIWSFLLSKEIGISSAEAILNAHENTPLEPQDEKAMDLANNRLAQIDFAKRNAKKITDKYITDLFKENLKNNKLIILKPKYKKNGGLP